MNLSGDGHSWVHDVTVQNVSGTMYKINEAGNSLNVVEHEPVPTRVHNPNASEASYKPKQRSYRTFCTEMVLYRNVTKQSAEGHRLISRLSRSNGMRFISSD